MSDSRKPLLPVSGARSGSLVRPVADGAVTPVAKPRFGLRVNASKLPLRPVTKPDREVG